jgi:hypothetical protein
MTSENSIQNSITRKPPKANIGLEGTRNLNLVLKDGDNSWFITCNGYIIAASVYKLEGKPDDIWSQTTKESIEKFMRTFLQKPVPEEITPQNIVDIKNIFGYPEKNQTEEPCDECDGLGYVESDTTCFHCDSCDVVCDACGGGASKQKAIKKREMTVCDVWVDGNLFANALDAIDIDPAEFARMWKDDGSILMIAGLDWRIVGMGLTP